uniref:Uncharacterized protein n=1 Tax=Megaselia scalaris TaxID=36166 RepID=T1H2M6_MEGSC
MKVKVVSKSQEQTYRNDHGEGKFVVVTVLFPNFFDDFTIPKEVIMFNNVVDLHGDKFIENEFVNIDNWYTKRDGTIVLCSGIKNEPISQEIFEKYFEDDKIKVKITSCSNSYGYKGDNCITMRFLLNDGFEIPVLCTYPKELRTTFEVNQELDLTRDVINFAYSDKQYFPNDEYQINLVGNEENEFVKM